MFKFLNYIIPKFIKKRIHRLANRYLDYNKRHPSSKNQYCPVCKNYISHFNRLPDTYFENFDKYGFIHSIFLEETINVLNYSCPVCAASDRERLYSLFIEEKMDDVKKEVSLIDFAPPKSLSNFITRYSLIKYRTADLLRDDVDDQVDITNMAIYNNEQFDAFICSHILEHVDDDIKAIKELYRILKNDGWGILMAPVNLGLKDVYENKQIKSPEERWKHFGQHDHLRAYSKQGYLNRIKSVGFKVKEYDVRYFGETIFAKCGINKRSVLYIVNK